MSLQLLCKEQVIERWDALIAGAAGNGTQIMADVKRLLDLTKVKDVNIEQQSIAAGVVQGLLGGKRSFIVISNTKNPNLRPINMYINARDYGVNLQISWFLVQKPTSGERFINSLLKIPIISLVIFPFYFINRISVSKESGILALNFFDEMDLRAYVTNAHKCLIEAVKKQTTVQKDNTDQMSNHSKGFLGIV